MDFQPTYRLKLYRNFKALGATDFHGRVRYYEEHEDALATLEFEPYFDCLLLYTQALYETGNYGKHVVMCDHLLEQIIMHNVESWGGEDVYMRVLHQKSASLVSLHELANAEHVLRELLKIYPRHEQARRLLLHSLLEQKPEWLQKIRAVAVGLTLLAACAIAIEIFVIKPFFPWYFDVALLVHNLLLGGGILTFAIGEWRHYGICRKRSYGFADTVYKQKTQRRC